VNGATATHDELLKRAPDAPMTQLLTARLALIKRDYATAVAESQKVVTAIPDFVPARLLLGSALVAQGGLNQAEVQFAEAVRTAPDNVEARKLLAQVNLQLQRPDVALRVLAPTQQGDAVDPQLDALMGLASLQHGDESAGIALLERSSQAQPANSELKLNLAAAYMRAGQNDKAVDLLTAMPRTSGATQRDQLLITALAAAKGPQAARAEMDRLVAANPKDAAVLNLAAEFYARGREFDRARQLLNTALGVQPTNATTLINLARVDVAAGNTSGATASIKKALAADPANAAARLALAEITLRSGDIAAATPLLEQIRASDANALEPRLLLARIYLQGGEAAKADAVFAEVLRGGNGVPAVANVVGQLYLDAGRFDEALGRFNDAASQKPDDIGYALNVARAQDALGQDASARQTMEKVAAAHPESIPANAALVLRDLRDRRYDAAAARVGQLKKVHPADPAVMTLQGDVALAEKAYPAAASAYEAAAATAPSSALALRTYRARLLGKLPNPLAPLEGWLEKRPGDLAARMVLAEAYSSAGQRALAIKQYEQAVQGERPNAMALNNLAWLYHEAGDARAAETAKRAYTAAPKSAPIADTYGWILVQSGKVPEGLAILEKAVADSRSQPDIRYHYAAALAKSGKRDLALSELKELSHIGQKYSSEDDARKLLSELGG
jgi:putative PEP-CTERM system TPR-repeat lipoprotein